MTCCALLALQFGELGGLDETLLAGDAASGDALNATAAPTLEEVAAAVIDDAEAYDLTAAAQEQLGAWYELQDTLEASYGAAVAFFILGAFAGFGLLT